VSVIEDVRSLQVQHKPQLSIMSQTVVETPSTTAHIVTIPTHAYISDLDSEERAVPVLHMAPLSSAGYQQIPPSDRPRSDPEERLTALDNPKSESDSEQIRLGNKCHSNK